MFEKAVENTSGKNNNLSLSGAYWEGARQALGWVIGQYSEDPEKAAEL